MIKLTNMFFENHEAIGALIKVGEYPLSHDGYYKHGYYWNKLSQHQRAYMKEREAIIAKFTEKDEKGKPVKRMEAVTKEDGTPVLNGDGTPAMKSIGYVWTDETAANEAIKVLLQQEITIEQNKVLPSDWGKVELLPQQWEALSPFVMGQSPYQEE
jgi:hypothetical protein